jgi:hypothetical protein
MVLFGSVLVAYWCSRRVEDELERITQPGSSRCGRLFRRNGIDEFCFLATRATESGMKKRRAVRISPSATSSSVVVQFKWQPR